MARRFRWVAAVLACALLLAPRASLGEDRVGYSSLGACVVVTDATGELFITTVPASSDVWVDDAKVGTSSAASPGRFQTSLSPGEHRVEVRKADYANYSFSACIRNNQITYHEVRIEFTPAPPPTPTPPPSPNLSTATPSPSPSPSPSPNATPAATKAPSVTVPSLLAFLDNALSDGRIPESEEVALRAALDRLRAGGNTSPAPFTPSNASCRAIAASIIREVGGCARVEPSAHPSTQSACCSLAGTGATQPPSPRRSPGFEAGLALAALGATAALMLRRRR